MRLLVGHPKNPVGEPAPKRLVVTELFEKFRVVLHQTHDDTFERLVVLDAGVLLVRVLPSILVRGIGRDFLRDVLGYKLAHAVDIQPRNVPKLVVKGFEDV